VKPITIKQILKLDRVVLKKVKGIPNPHEKGGEKKDASWIGSGYTKIYIWTLLEYQKVSLTSTN